MGSKERDTGTGEPLAPTSRAGSPYRPGRVAVASETGEHIDACFGRTGCFRIYALADDGGVPAYVPLETRPGPKPCRDREHDLESLSACADLLSDCGMVLAGRIGPAAIQILASRGILGLSVRLPLDEALRRLAAR